MTKKELIKKYPLVFGNKIDRTPYALFGIECGDGWLWLLDKLASYITDILEGRMGYVEERDVEKEFYVLQVKEKFGELRFYWQLEGNCSKTFEQISNVVSFAEYLSNFICEDCGSIHHVETRDVNGWLTTLCDNCYNIRLNREVEDEV
ncbi:MAG: hypothetical protein J7L15_05335 [Clostridiales bacterium]|nr:hypothetical protein [Clostridiales bacterium]